MSPLIVLTKPNSTLRGKPFDAAAEDEFYRLHAEPVPAWMVIAFRLARLLLEGAGMHSLRLFAKLRRLVLRRAGKTAAVYPD